MLWRGHSLKRPEPVFEALHFGFQTSQGFAGAREVFLLGTGFQPRGYSNRLEGQKIPGRALEGMSDACQFRSVMPLEGASCCGEEARTLVQMDLDEFTHQLSIPSQTFQEGVPIHGRAFVTNRLRFGLHVNLGRTV